MHGLFRLVRRRLKWIVGSILICVLFSIVISFVTKPIYESTVIIELNKNGGSLDFGLGDLLSQQFNSGTDSLLNDLQTESSILQSDSLALAVIQRLQLSSRPPFAPSAEEAANLESEKGLPLDQSPRTRTRLLRIFKSRLKVASVRGTRLIQVTYQSNDPRQAAEIANALIESYKAQYLQSHYEATSEASEWLTKQLSDLKSNVEESEKKLTDFEKETGILSLNTMPANSGASAGEGQIHSVVIQKLDALNAELTAAEANRIGKEALYRIVETNNDDVILGLSKDPLALQSNSMVLTQGGGLSNLQQLRQERNELRTNIAQASITLGANNRHLKELQARLSALEDEIHQELQEIIKRAQTDFELAQQTEGELRKRFVQQQAEASKLNEKAVQYAVLSQEASSRKKLYEDLYTKLQEANVAAGIKATNITVVDPARTQSVPVRPNRKTNLALGILVGLFVGIGAALTVESLDRTVSDPAELEEITEMSVVGVIPDFDEKGRTYGARLAYGARRLRKEGKDTPDPPHKPSEVLMLTQPHSVAAEAIRALRTTILLSRAGGEPRVLLVTSCAAGEGKTTVTTNLAVAMAQHNKRVIIVEADLRRPQFERTMKIPNEVGLSSVLAGSSTSEEAIHRGVHVPTLDVLPAGPRPPRPADVLASAAFDQLLKHLREHYDMVLIDSPPALLVTDAVEISLKTDAVIWVAQAGIVTRPQLARAKRLVERDRMPVIGFVMNRIRRKDAVYGYEYSSSYYDEDNSNGA